MITRLVTDRLNKHIAHMPAVALLGARQVGKTTLAKTIAKGRDAIYLDLEAPEDLLKLSDPSSFFHAHNVMGSGRELTHLLLAIPHFLR